MRRRSRYPDAPGAPAAPAPPPNAVWIAEYGWHQNINVGCPTGWYKSWSFGVDEVWHLLIPFRTGSIYDDPRTGGKIIKFFPVTPQEAKRIMEVLKSMEGDRMTYGIPSGNCRTFSNDMFEVFEEIYGPGKK
jgi:hypothetical protein